MNQFSGILNQILPIFIFLFIGSRIRAKEILYEQTVEDMKKLVVNLALPAVLFLSFAKIDLGSSYLVLSLVLFGLCAALFLVGKVIGSRFFSTHPYFPHMMSGFEYGMLALSLFGSAYGIENIGYIAVVDLGHEIYIWFFLVPLLLIRRDGAASIPRLFRTVFSNPVIISIILGIGVNLLGVMSNLEKAFFTGAIISVCEFLSQLTIPLMLIIVGYGIRFEFDGLAELVQPILIRFALTLPVIFLFNKYVIREWLELGKPFEIALFTLLIMPSPFIIPLFMKASDGLEKTYINNILAIQTFICVLIFSVWVVFNPTL